MAAENGEWISNAIQSLFRGFVARVDHPTIRLQKSNHCNYSSYIKPFLDLPVAEQQVPNTCLNSTSTMGMMCCSMHTRCIHIDHPIANTSLMTNRKYYRIHKSKSNKITNFSRSPVCWRYWRSPGFPSFFLCSHGWIDLYCA